MPHPRTQILHNLRIAALLALLSHIILFTTAAYLTYGSIYSELDRDNEVTIADCREIIARMPTNLTSFTSDPAHVLTRASPFLPLGYLCHRSCKIQFYGRTPATAQPPKWLREGDAFKIWGAVRAAAELLVQEGLVGDRLGALKIDTEDEFGDKLSMWVTDAPTENSLHDPEQIVFKFDG